MQWIKMRTVALDIWEKYGTFQGWWMLATMYVVAIEGRSVKKITTQVDPPILLFLIIFKKKSVKLKEK